MPRLEHIGLDVDGVLRDLASQLVRVFEREHPALVGQCLPIDQWPDWWGFDRYFPSDVDLYGFTKKFHEELWLEAPAYAEVERVFQRLSRDRTVHIVTTQLSHRSADLTRLWLERNGIPVPLERYHVTRTKQDAPIQLLVDDMHHNLEAVQLAGIVGVCVERPWNGPWEGFRISDLEGLFEVLEALERE